MRAGPTALTALLLACAPRSDPATTGLSVGDAPETTTTTTAAETTASSGSDATSTWATSSTTEASGAASDYPKDDLGAPDMGDVGTGCNGKIDVLFVFPNAGNEYFDAAMPVSLPAFEETMATTLADYDLHVMVLNASGRWGAPNVCPKDKCPADGPCPALEDPSFPCWALHDEESLTKCDDTPGAGVVFPAGQEASNIPCLPPDGQRFLSSSAPDFSDLFACVTKFGGGGKSPIGLECIMRAVSPDLQYGCNAGFVRDDAVLLIFVVTVSDYSAYSPAVWANAVLEAKEREHDRVVVMTVSPDRSTDEPVCPGKKVDTHPPSYKFSMLFEHGLQGSYCAPDYGPYFEEAAALAAELCGAGPQG